VENVPRIDAYLVGANFPATKQQLVARAYSNGATAELLAAFHALPEREYVSARDVTRALPQSA
jgi:hypothetical protein